MVRFNGEKPGSKVPPIQRFITKSNAEKLYSNGVLLCVTKFAPLESDFGQLDWQVRARCGRAIRQREERNLKRSLS